MGRVKDLAWEGTPNKWSTLNSGVGTVTLPAPDTRGAVQLHNDQDLGAGGALLAYPQGQTGFTNSPFVVIAAGKEGVAYVIDPTNMGTGGNGADGMDPCGSLVLQCFAAFTLPPAQGGVIPDGSGARALPAFWGGDNSKGTDTNILYTAGSKDTHLNYWSMDLPSKNATFDTTVFATGKPPLHGSSNTFPYPGGIPVVSWDDTVSSPVARDAIVWVVDSSGFQNATPAILLAYPALPVAGSQNNPPLFQDSGSGVIAVKWTVPVVANGQVYIAGQQVTHVCSSSDTSCPGMVARYSP